MKLSELQLLLYEEKIWRAALSYGWIDNDGKMYFGEANEHHGDIDIDVGSNTHARYRILVQAGWVPWIIEGGTIYLRTNNYDTLSSKQKRAIESLARKKKLSVVADEEASVDLVPEQPYETSRR